MKGFETRGKEVIIMETETGKKECPAMKGFETLSANN